jgi:hypothetical protein
VAVEGIKEEQASLLIEIEAWVETSKCTFGEAVELGNGMF